MIKFSILVAHYNNYNYFTECYDSILKQTYQEYEIILVDDCSTDDSYEKIIELTKDNSKVKVFKNEENSGVGLTKKRCIDLASGEICGFVDPDDTLTENALQTIIENYTENNIVVYSQFYECDAKLNPIKLFSHSRAIKNGNKLFFNVFFEATHFFTFKREAYYKTSGINDKLTSAVDQDLYLKLYEIGNFKFVKAPLYYYRIHEKGVSQESSKKEKLHKNWHQTILDTTKRRKINSLYGEKITDIENLPGFLKVKQNSIFKKIQRKFL
ncbi:glycosyltransferase family 2 protein [Chryseobacterium balustinum]|jgi:glycosyltransferase involved in cell wall biosynthesis|uniref:Glycosyltransferase involved in cell wall bisynthesis n=1 Tax=Chryseobacterium balustinum TaxID=246 RepID=A0AAX2IGN4_9FLAO|nr:glycosyltransferase family 2 protein [Chryseobacterium balustinum]AZB31084.1 glycosyltransferase family 2 protein [Chryseobacterium balustinum]SKB40425.1 Glycosyltransferase involved in cell wall bisynthesis [Chryseobacterium balustinum]SQA87800.1 Hyaluronan synthase [Chryseobacterium balustinum]